MTQMNSFTIWKEIIPDLIFGMSWTEIQAKQNRKNKAC